MTKQIGIDTEPITESFPITFSCGEARGCAVAQLDAWRKQMANKYGGTIYDGVSGWQTNCADGSGNLNYGSPRGRNRPSNSRCSIQLTVVSATVSKRP